MRPSPIQAVNDDISSSRLIITNRTSGLHFLDTRTDISLILRVRTGKVKQLSTFHLFAANGLLNTYGSYSRLNSLVFANRSRDSFTLPMSRSLSLTQTF